MTIFYYFTQISAITQDLRRNIAAAAAAAAVLLYAKITFFFFSVPTKSLQFATLTINAPQISMRGNSLLLTRGIPKLAVNQQ